MPKCSVKSCKNNTLTTLKKDGISYFRFPKNEIERDKWRQIIARERGEEYFKPNDSTVICSCHFTESDMYLTKTGLRKLYKCVIPRIEIDISESLPTQSSTGTITNTTLSSIAIERNYTVTKANRNTPSPTSSGLTSIFDSPKTSSYKKNLRIYQKTIDLKNKQIQNIKKKNQRLMKRNISLKEMVTDLKKKIRLLNLVNK